MKEMAINNRECILKIKSDLAMGIISYDEAKKKAKPIVDAINLRARALAKKYGRKPQLLSVASILR